MTLMTGVLDTDVRNPGTLVEAGGGFWGEADPITVGDSREIGVATAWRYVQEAIALLSSAADDLDTAMRRIRLLAVHDPGRHPDPDRPGRGPEAVLLRKT